MGFPRFQNAQIISSEQAEKSFPSFTIPFQGSPPAPVFQPADPSSCGKGKGNDDPPPPLVMKIKIWSIMISTSTGVWRQDGLHILSSLAEKDCFYNHCCPAKPSSLPATCHLCEYQCHVAGNNGLHSKAVDSGLVNQ